MQIAVTAKEVREILRSVRREGKTIGVVPTMGALHDGHFSLVDTLRGRCDFLVMWAFVNPTQFNDINDYRNYPRTPEKDAAGAKAHEVDLLFVPDVSEIYPAGTEAYYERKSVRVTAGDRSLGFEGEHRPGHFDGVVHVCTVMFNIIRPDFAVFGEKDYQQVQVIKQLNEDLHLGIELVVAPIVRDADGLAMSSRNVLLNERSGPLSISKALMQIKAEVAAGQSDVSVLEQEARLMLENAGLRPDYVSIVDAETLKPVKSIENEAQLLVAAFTDNNVRLIDNMRLRRGG